MERVGALVLRSSQRADVARAIDWLVQDVLARSEDPVVQRAALEAGVALAASDRIAGAMEVLYGTLIEDWADTAMVGLRRFAAHLLSRCSIRGVSRATQRLVQLSVESRMSWPKQEMVGWLAGAFARAAYGRTAHTIAAGLVEMGLRSAVEEVGVKLLVVQELRSIASLPGSRRSARIAVEGLAQIALTSGSPEVELPVVDALDDLARSEGTWQARLAIRCLLKMAMATESSDLGHALGRRLADVVLRSALVNAKIAVRGLLKASAQGDTAFREQSWGTLKSALDRPVHPAIRAELRRALSELMRMREEALQETNAKPEARAIAPAA